MSLNNETLLSTTAAGGTTAFFSDTVKAAGFYRGYGPVQTIFCDATGLVGNVRYWATIVEDPASPNWFTLDDAFLTPHVVEGTNASPYTGVDSYTVTGNFVWIKAEIRGFTAGTINSITMSY